MAKENKKKDETSIRIYKDTKMALIKLKYQHGFSSIDALINALLTNTERLKEVLKQ